MVGIVAERGAPRNIRCDNPTELTALRDWCTASAVSIRYIEPGAPWQNSFAESFNARVRDELLNLEEFSWLLRQSFELSEPNRVITSNTREKKIPRPSSIVLRRTSAVLWEVICVRLR